MGRRKNTDEDKVDLSVSDSKRIGLVIIKLIIFTIIHIVIWYIGGEVFRLLVLPNLINYEKFSLVKLLVSNTNNIRNSDYVKYAYTCIGLESYAVLSELVLLVRTMKKFICITQDECIDCEKYLKCKYKDIRIERNY